MRALALLLQAVFGVADATQRFSPVPAPWPSDGNDRPFRPSSKNGSYDGFEVVSVWDSVRKTWLIVKTEHPPLTPRSHYAVALAGQRLFVWGGWAYDSGVQGDGAVLNVSRKSWKRMSAAGAPAPRLEPTAVVWTGARLLVWGGRQATTSPGSLRWPPMARASAAASERFSSAAASSSGAG